MKIKFLLVFLIMLSLKNTLLANETVNLYDFSFEDIDGNQVNLEKFTGKPSFNSKYSFKMWFHSTV